MPEQEQENCPDWLPQWGEVERKLSEQELSCERDLELKETKLKAKKWVNWVWQNVETRGDARGLMDEVIDWAKVVWGVVAEWIDYVFWGSEVSAATPEEMEKQHYEGLMGEFTETMKEVKKEDIAKKMGKVDQLDPKFNKEYEALSPEEQLKFFWKLWALKRDALDRYKIAKDNDKLTWRSLARVAYMLYRTYDVINEYEHYFQFPWSKAPWIAMDWKLKRLVKLSPSNANLADLIKTYQDKYDTVFKERDLEIDIMLAKSKDKLSKLLEERKIIRQKLKSQEEQLKKLRKINSSYDALLKKIQ